MKTFARILDEYDGLALVWHAGKPAVIISRAEDLRTFFTSKSTIDRADVYQIIGDFTGDYLLTVGGEVWKKIRKLFKNNFQATPREILVINALKASEYMTQELKEKADGSYFPCIHIVMRTALKSLMGSALNMPLTEEEENGIVHNLDCIVRLLYKRMYTIIPHDMIFTATGRQFKKTNNKFHAIVKDIVEKQSRIIQEIKAKKDYLPDNFVTKLIDKSGCGNKIIQSEMASLIFAGLDTTAHTMAFLILLLGIHPEVQEKVYQEVTMEYKRQGNREMKAEDAKNYHYLDCVIKETLRLFPVAPAIGRKISEDTYFGRYLVPAGTDVGYSPLYSNYLPEYFPEPRKFKPERFASENITSIPAYAFNPFSNGPRICPGKTYATLAMKIYTSVIVRNFKISAQYKTLEEALNNLLAEMILMDKNGFMIKLEKRNNDEC